MRLITGTILSSALLSACLLLGCAATDGEQTHSPEPAPESTVAHTPEPTATYTAEAAVTHTPETTATYTPEAAVAHTPEPTPTHTPEATVAHTPEPTVEHTPEATPATSYVRPSTYLEATVEPCVGLEGSSVDPCERRGGDIDNDPFPSTGSADSVIMGDAPTLEEIMVWSSRGEWGQVDDVPHFVVRGTYMPKTTRCAVTQYLKVALTNDVRISGPISADTNNVIDCLTDFSASEYIVGRGPQRLTVRTAKVLAELLIPGYSDSRRGEVTDELLATLVAPPVVETYEGGEWIIWIGTPNNVAVKYWPATDLWDVQRDGSEIKVVHWAKKWFKPSEINEARLEFTLEDYRREVKKAHANFSKLYEGRIGEDEDLPLLFADANDEFFEEFITSRGAYDYPDVLTPLAFPIPGEGDAYTPGARTDDAEDAGTPSAGPGE